MEDVLPARSLDVTVKDLVSLETCRPQFVHPWQDSRQRSVIAESEISKALG